jgi:SAM-dependent methyltransferase
LRVYAFQPATALWRAVEVGALQLYFPQAGTCLDLGCGDGKLTAILKSLSDAEGLTLVGIDADPQECKWAMELGLYQRVHQCSADNIPEPSGSFDCVISNSVLEHVPDVEGVIMEIARLLRDGGTFVFTVPSPGFHQCLGAHRSDSARRAVYLADVDRRLAHFRYWTAAEWADVLARHNLGIAQQVEYLGCDEVRRWEQISRLTAGVLYALARRKHSPIDIQRGLGLRSLQQRFTLPFWLAQPLSVALCLGLRDTPSVKAGLLICANKRSGTRV